MPGSRAIFLVLLLMGLLGPQASALRVCTLHPLLTDLAKQVGGGDVEVVSLMPAGSDPHHFSPSASQLARMSNSKIVLAMGKRLESYLPELKDKLKQSQVIYEVGRTIPSITVKEGPLFVCCPVHASGTIDPHWWHSIRNMQRASTAVAKEFGKLDPANKGAYETRAKAYNKRLDALRVWAGNEISKIPRSARKLATVHAAWGYFCEEFGFKSVMVQGLNKEQKASSKHLQETVNDIKDQKVRALFPEDTANLSALKFIAQQTGVKIGGKLNTNGCGTGSSGTFEGMMRHNISTIVASLR